jgi:hypothetical protein
VPFPNLPCANHGAVLLHGECDGARGRDVARGSIHGHRISARSGSGIACICAASVSAIATSDKGAGEHRHQGESCQPCPPAAAAQRDANADANEQGEGQCRPAGVASVSPGMRGMNKGGAGRGGCGDGERGRSSGSAGNGDRAGCTEAQRGQILSTGRFGCDDRRYRYAAGEAPALGVTVIVEVLPVVAPAATVTAAPPTVKLGGTTVTVAVPVADW